MNESIYSLVQELIYPLTLLIILALFRKPLSRFIENLGKANLKIDKTGIDLKTEAIGLIVESSLNNIPSDEDNHRREYISNTVEGIETTINKLNSNIDELKYKKILWVDDHPEWSFGERRAFETMGITIISSFENNDALNKIKGQKFDLIISDYFSDQGHKKGLDLLKGTSRLHFNVPVIFYTSRATKSLKIEARENGAYGIVDSSGELSSLVLKSLIST